MDKIKVDKFRIKNFKAFREEVEIKFNNKNLLIYGNNGAGKSSIFWALYTILQSTEKNDAEIKKYFKVFNPADPSTDQSLRNMFEDQSEDSFVCLNFQDDTDDYKISLNDLSNIRVDKLKILNATSEFINYKLLSNFYNSSHKYDLNIWPIFERDIFPYLTEPTSTENYLKYIQDRTQDAPTYSSGRYFKDGWQKDNFNRQLSDLNTKISSLLADIQRFANEFITAHFYNNEERLRIKLDFDKPFHFNLLKRKIWEEENKYIRNEELRIKLTIEQKDETSGNWHSINRVQSLLNEAQLTRIAFSIRIGALKTRIQDLYPKILVIDDMLISLDMSNRLEVIKMILNVENKRSLRFFDTFQKIILTHDKGFYNIIKNYTNDAKWDYYYLSKEENSTDAPVLTPEKNHLVKAANFLRLKEYDSCGNELRKELESILKKYLNQGQNIIVEEFKTLKSMLKSAYEKYTLDERRNFEKTFLNDGLALDDLKKIETDFEADSTLSDETKGRLRNSKKRVLKYLILQQEIKKNKDLIFDELNNFLDRIMNPSSHSTTVPLYEAELEKAIKLITDFKAEIEK